MTLISPFREHQGIRFLPVAHRPALMPVTVTLVGKFRCPHCATENTVLHATRVSDIVDCFDCESSFEVAQVQEG